MPVDPPRPEYITQPLHTLRLLVCRREEQRDIGLGGLTAHFGRLLVTVQVHGYSKCHRRTFEAFERVELHGIPPMEHVTTACWLLLGCPPSYPPPIVHRSCSCSSLLTCTLLLSSALFTLFRELTGPQLVPEGSPAGGSSTEGRALAPPLDFVSGLHAANHAMLVACCLLLDCDTSDVCCEHQSSDRLLLYDSAAGGTGLARQAFDRVESLIETAVELLEACGCTNGCPSCVFTSVAGCYNDGVCKRSGLALLKGIKTRTTAADLDHGAVVAV